MQATNFERITVNPDQMGGVPCVRGLRVPVATVLRMLAGGMTEREILADYPDLEVDDIRECLRFAAVTAMEREIPIPAPREIPHRQRPLASSGPPTSRGGTRRGSRPRLWFRGRGGPCHPRTCSGRGPGPHLCGLRLCDASGRHAAQQAAVHAVSGGRHHPRPGLREPDRWRPPVLGRELDAGCVVVFRRGRIPVRSLPFAGSAP